MFEKHTWHKENGQSKNSLIRERCGCKLSVLKRVERNMLKLLRHVERIGEESLAQRLYQGTILSNRGAGKLHRSVRY